jgi:xanthosine phosphorylase
MARSQDAARAICAALDGREPGWRPRVGLILGSGLGPVADSVAATCVLSYDSIPGFPRPSVEGHAGRLVLGRLGGVAVACLQGRVHLFEGADADDVRTLVHTLKQIGCEILVLTNASGSLRPDTIPPGSLMAISDHIDMTHFNPLVGPNDDSIGPRFPAMDGAYDPRLRDLLHQAADAVGVALHDGVYVGVVGPSFETPAEIRALQILGGDVVGMSTVPEVIVARHCGLRVAAISAPVCPGAGLGPSITHQQTLDVGAVCSKQLIKLLPAFMERLARDADGRDG